jgi:prevent-host-death family protein
MQVSVTEAKGKLTDLVRRAEAGEEVLLTRHGHLAVRLVAVESPKVSETTGAIREKRRRAVLNICDCFAYALAMDQGCPLLFVGDDFAKTDVVGVL